MARWALPLLLLLLVRCDGRIESGCGDVYAAVLDWHRRCGATLPDHALDRAATFCNAITGAKNIRWDMENTCARTLATAECGRFPRECVALSAGTLSEGAACSGLSSPFELHGQCRSGSCTITNERCGTCAGGRLEGESCGEGSACVPGLACRIEAGNTRGTCVTTTGILGASCGAATDCSADTQCDYNTRTCEPRQPTGARCWSGYECASGLVCAGVVGTCSAPARMGDSCLETDCASGLVCSLAKRCVQQTFAAPEQACDGNETVCVLGACSAGRCPTVIADGAPCVVGNPAMTCDAFARCISGKCTIPTGEPCP